MTVAFSVSVLCLVPRRAIVGCCAMSVVVCGAGPSAASILANCWLITPMNPRGRASMGSGGSFREPAEADPSSTTETSEQEETMSEHGLRQFTCAGCGWTSSDIGTFPNLAIPLCCTCNSDARRSCGYGSGGAPGGGGPSVG